MQNIEIELLASDVNFLSNSEAVIYYQVQADKLGKPGQGGAMNAVGGRLAMNRIGLEMYQDTEGYLKRFHPFESRDTVKSIRR